MQHIGNTKTMRNFYNNVYFLVSTVVVILKLYYGVSHALKSFSIILRYTKRLAFIADKAVNLRLNIKFVVIIMAVSMSICKLMIMRVIAVS